MMVDSDILNKRPRDLRFYTGSDSKSISLPESPLGFINVSDEHFSIDSLLEPLSRFGDDFEGATLMKDLLGRIGDYILTHRRSLKHYRISYNIMKKNDMMTLKFVGGDGDTQIYDFVQQLVPSLKEEKSYAEGRLHIANFGPHFTMRVVPHGFDTHYNPNP